MNEVKSALKRIPVYYLLLAINILPCSNIIADAFPTRNLSTIYLLILSVCLVLYYDHRVSPSGGLSVPMKLLSVTALSLILLRGIKYGVVPEIGALARHVWYLYYAPMLFLPLCLFFIALFASPKNGARLAGLRYGALAVTVLLVAAVLCNDLHQQIFRFRPDFADWDHAYSYGWLYYVVTAWQAALYLASIALLVYKCRIGSSRKSAWILLLPVAVGVALYALLATDTMPKLNGAHIVEFPEAHVCTTAVVLECCMQLGLIPTNTEYDRLFRNLSISAQITDKKGSPVYGSATSVPVTKEQFASESGSRVGEHTVLHKMAIPGGYGFWQDDMTTLDRLNDELEEAKEGLAQEAELIRLRNELKERQKKIEERTDVYNTVAKRTQRQSQTISRLAETALASTDPDLRDAHRRRITLLGAYIKRYANLMLLSRESDVTEIGELHLSVSEVLRYLNHCGKPGEFVGNARGPVSSAAALAALEAFETLLEDNYESLSGVFVNLSGNDAAFLFKTIFENPSCGLTERTKKDLAAAGVTSDITWENDVLYVCFTLPKGGAK